MVAALTGSSASASASPRPGVSWRISRGTAEAARLCGAPSRDGAAAVLGWSRGAWNHGEPCRRCHASTHSLAFVPVSCCSRSPGSRRRRTNRLKSQGKRRLAMSRRASRPFHLLWSHLMLCLHAYMPPHASMLPQSLARAEPCGDSQSLGIRCCRPAGREAREKVSQERLLGGTWLGRSTSGRARRADVAAGGSVSVGVCRLLQYFSTPNARVGKPGGRL
jgi:hypothetical protein